MNPQILRWRNYNGSSLTNEQNFPQYPPLTINAIESSNFFNPERNNQIHLNRVK